MHTMALAVAVGTLTFTREGEAVLLHASDLAVLVLEHGVAWPRAQAVLRPGATWGVTEEQALTSLAVLGASADLVERVRAAFAMVGDATSAPVRRPMGGGEGTARAAAYEDELRRVVAVYDACGGNATATAEELGIPRRTLYRRLHDAGVMGKVVKAAEPAVKAG